MLFPKVGLVLVILNLIACQPTEQQGAPITTQRGADANKGKTSTNKTCLKVVNGSPTSDFPAVVLLGAKIQTQRGEGYSSCSGSFVSDNTLITAAHCVQLSGNGGMFYIPGSVVDDLPSAFESQKIAPLKMIRDSRGPAVQGGPEISPTSSIYDLAILIFPDNTAKATMPILGATPKNGTPTTLVGYGKTVTDPSTPEPDSRTIKRFGRNFIILPGNSKTQDLTQALVPGMIATRGRTETQGAFSSSTKDSTSAPGDSGGPLIIDGALSAVVSYGFTDQSDNLDNAIYTDITSPQSKALIEKAKKEGARIFTAEELAAKEKQNNNLGNSNSTSGSSTTNKKPGTNTSTTSEDSDCED